MKRSSQCGGQAREVRIDALFLMVAKLVAEDRVNHDVDDRQIPAAARGSARPPQTAKKGEGGSRALTSYCTASDAARPACA